MPQSSHYLAVYYLQTSFLTFSAPVIQYEVQFEILSIPNNKAHACIGLYSCPSRILSSDSSILSYLLANIFYTLIDYSPRLKRIIVLVYTHEVISTKSGRKPLKSTIWLTDQITRKFKNRSLQNFQTWQLTSLWLRKQQRNGLNGTVETLNCFLIKYLRRKVELCCFLLTREVYRVKKVCCVVLRMKC